MNTDKIRVHGRYIMLLLEFMELVKVLFKILCEKQCYNEVIPREKLQNDQEVA